MLRVFVLRYARGTPVSAYHLKHFQKFRNVRQSCDKAEGSFEAHLGVLMGRSFERLYASAWYCGSMFGVVACTWQKK